MSKKLPPAIVEWFRKQGAKGGARTWANMTPEERTARAKKMIAAREAKRAEKKGKP